MAAPPDPSSRAAGLLMLATTALVAASFVMPTDALTATLRLASMVPVVAAAAVVARGARRPARARDEDRDRDRDRDRSA